MAVANHTRVFNENEPQSKTPIMDLYRDWQAYFAWLDGPACAEMGEVEYDLHVAALTCLERRIGRTSTVTAQDLAAQIEVLTHNWQDDGCGDDLRALVSRTAARQDVGVAA